MNSDANRQEGSEYGKSRADLIRTTELDQRVDLWDLASAPVLRHPKVKCPEFTGGRDGVEAGSNGVEQEVWVNEIFELLYQQLFKS